MQSVVESYIAKGYAVTTLRLDFDTTTGKKVPRFKSRWQQATRDNCLQEFVNFSDNAIAIVTGEASDLLVIDADHLKPKEIGNVMDGLEFLNRKIQGEGLSAITPIAKTGSGGKHLFFSLAKSMQAGLIFTRNRSKIYVDDKPTSLDARADGGGILCAPTKYKAGDEIREYSFQVPLCAVDELEAAPAWLIDILNRDTLRNGSPSSSSAVVARFSSNRQLANMAGSSFYTAVKSIVEMVIGNQIAQQWDRQNGFDFSVQNKEHPCVICNGIHTSNNYACRQILTSCFTLSNYSTTCRPVTMFNYADHPVICKILECPTTDDPFVALLQTKYDFTNQQLKASGDENNPSFYLYDGKRWKQEADISIQQDLRLSAYHVIDQLSRHLREKMTHSSGDCKTLLENHLKSLRAAKIHIQRAGNIKSITASAKQLLWDQDFAGKLDMNPDLLCAGNGVIDLVSGDLRIGQPEDCVSKAIKTDFMGLDYPSPDIEAFFYSIFEDHDIVKYMQRLLGYAITGHTREQVFCVCSGSGSNGKGVLFQILEALLGYAMVSMSPDCIIKRGRAAGKGAPTPFLAALRGARLAICDEAPEDAVLDEESVKRATGQTTIEARFLGANPIYFKPTHLPMLLTNYRPTINIADEAVLRRLLIIPFDLTFKIEEELNPGNQSHRLMDKLLAERLLTSSHQQQLLSWLVRGSVEWQAHGLPQTPGKMSAAFREYVAENDHLQTYIDAQCEIGDGFEVETVRFAKLFNEDFQQNMRQGKVNSAMAKKGFLIKQSYNFQKRTMAFQGIRLTSAEDFVDSD